MTPSPVLKIFDDVDRATKRASDAMQVKCPSTCGTCCDNPSVMAHPVEMLPAAQALLAEGRAQALLHQAEQALAHQQPCVFFERRNDAPHAHGHVQGRCGAYAWRPTLCRLFGFAGFRNARGQVELAACWVHHETQPDAMDRAHDQVAAGHVPLPVFADVEHRVLALAQDGTPEVPINAALAQALRTVLKVSAG